MSSDSRLLSPLVLVAGLLLGGLLLPATLPQSVRAQESSPTQQDKAMHYSLYYESFKNDDFKAARSDLAWILENAPGFPKGDDRNFRRQYKLYAGLAKAASDDAQRRAYADSAAALLATAPQKMDGLGLSYDAYKWELYRGRFLQQYGSVLSERPDSLTTATAHYQNAFELAPSQIDPYYIRQVVQNHLDSNRQDEALSFMNAVESKRGDDPKVQKIVASARKDIFGKNPQAQVTYLEEQYEAHPDSAEIMLSLFDAYVEQGNISEASALAPKLMKTNPPAETVREIAQMRLDDGRPQEALQAYDRAAKQGATLKAEDHVHRGRAHKQMGNFSEARTAYRTAIEMDPSYAEAYVGIGDLYTQAVSECSQGELGRKDKAVYWAAVDQYEQAIEADSSIASVANNKIQSYRKVFPTKEDIFYREDWTQGGRFTIDDGCYSWINETTTVRPAP
jgi:tetratricopeptide (TPR) repeat protein